MMRLRIEHATGFRYPGDVGASYNEARMLPSSTDAQFVLSSQLAIDPSTSVNYYADYFGTRVAAFDVLAGHSALDITARSLVEVRPRPIEFPEISWDRLARESLRAIETVEMLGQSGRTEPHPEVAEIARSIAAQHDNPGRAALAIATAIGEAMEYMPGITGVHSTGAEAWVERKGVCQDITHITLGALREVGIPARYVSATYTPTRTPRSASPSPANRTPGWSGSRAIGRGSTRPTASRSATGTFSSAAAATTTTCPRYAVCTPGRTRAICTCR